MTEQNTIQIPDASGAPADIVDPPGGAAPVPPTHRDLQRGALQELVELATQCANMEIDLGRGFLTSQTDAENLSTRSFSDLDRSYSHLQEQIAQKVKERQSTIDQRFQQTIAQLRANDVNTRKHARHDFETVQNQSKEKYDQAVWLAESVLESSESKIAGEIKNAHETFERQHEQLVDKKVQTHQLLDRYSFPAPNLNSEPDPANVQALEIPFDQILQMIDQHLDTMSKLSIPNFFVGPLPYLNVLLVLGICVAAPQAIAQTLTPHWGEIAIWVITGMVFLTTGLIVLYQVGRKRVLEAYLPLRDLLDSARVRNQIVLEEAKVKCDTETTASKTLHEMELTNARDIATPLLEAAKKKNDLAIHNAQGELEKKLVENEIFRRDASAELDQWQIRKNEEVDQRYDAEKIKIGQRTESQRTEMQKQFAEQRTALEDQWAKGLVRIREPIADSGAASVPWSDPSWNNWKAPKAFPQTVRFGDLQIDPKQIIADVAKENPFTLPLPETFNVPALMVFPRQASMMIHTERTGRTASVRAIQMIMARLLTSLPPGRVRFTLVDPVGLGQSFAGFMHLADYDEALVGSRIWTDAEHIDQRLANLTEHMETVIQKYLRNEFATIDEYNAQAGELAEPYRFMVIADFPTNFSDEAYRRLSSIASTGARCGVYTLIMRDTRLPVSSASHVEDLESHSINLVYQDEKFIWRDQVFSRFPLKLDEPPSEEELTKILHQVGEKAREAKRVEVSFDTIAPKPQQFWTLKSASDLQVAVGRTGATRLQSFRLGKGVAQHALIAGKTGSGKSNLLHALVSNLAMWYSPDEVELYLIDFKKGVEFKTYATHDLPHARAIAVESDREFGLSVLQRIDAEMIRRGDLFRKAGVQDLNGYRQSTNQALPRTLLIIDEYQEFFTEDDKLAQDAALLLDRLVRQGRAFGVHLVLGSQTIGGSSGLSRSTIGQIAVRVALQTSEADSQLILGDGNSAARLLSRPGEAIYNDAGGLVEGNSPFQVAFLPDEKRDVYLSLVSKKAQQSGARPPQAIVFEGNAMADPTKNRPLMDLLGADRRAALKTPPQVWLGEPVSIKAATSISLRRQSGANILIIGQNEEAGFAMVGMSLISLAAQLPPAALTFYILDGAPADSAAHGALPRVATSQPNPYKLIEYRNVPDAMNELAMEMRRRHEADAVNDPAIVVLIYGLQRYRALRKTEDTFNFSPAGDAPNKLSDPSKDFAEILRDGPAVGIHVIAWIDTATALDRTLDRTSMREFDNRVLFQMSAADSSNLIDSPAANKLGTFRAVAFSEEQGTLEKFRPYAIPDAAFLSEIKKRLTAKPASAKE